MRARAGSSKARAASNCPSARSRLARLTRASSRSGSRANTLRKNSAAGWARMFGHANVAAELEQHEQQVNEGDHI